jgi:hypothetical protein
MINATTPEILLVIKILKKLSNTPSHSFGFKHRLIIWKNMSKILTSIIFFYRRVKVLCYKNFSNFCLFSIRKLMDPTKINTKKKKRKKRLILIGGCYNLSSPSENEK